MFRWFLLLSGPYNRTYTQVHVRLLLSHYLKNCIKDDTPKKSNTSVHKVTIKQ